MKKNWLIIIITSWWIKKNTSLRSQNLILHINAKLFRCLLIPHKTWQLSSWCLPLNLFNVYMWLHLTVNPVLTVLTALHCSNNLITTQTDMILEDCYVWDWEKNTLLWLCICSHSSSNLCILITVTGVSKIKNAKMKCHTAEQMQSRTQISGNECSISWYHLTWTQDLNKYCIKYISIGVDSFLKAYPLTAGFFKTIYRTLTVSQLTRSWFQEWNDWQFNFWRNFRKK